MQTPTAAPPALSTLATGIINDVQALPEKSVEELKENVQWIMNNPPK